MVQNCVPNIVSEMLIFCVFTAISLTIKKNNLKYNYKLSHFGRFKIISSHMCMQVSRRTAFKLSSAIFVSHRRSTRLILVQMFMNENASRRSVGGLNLKSAVVGLPRFSFMQIQSV